MLHEGGVFCDPLIHGGPQGTDGFVGAHDNFHNLDLTVVVQGEQVYANTIKPLDLALKLQRPIIPRPHDATVFKIGEDFVHVLQYGRHGIAAIPCGPIGRWLEFDVICHERGYAAVVMCKDKVVEFLDRWMHV